jgi:hypothetical protein
VNKEKYAFDWVDKEGMLDCVKAITPVINSGKCDVHHHPNGKCAIAIVYNSLPCVNACAFFESGVFERAAVIAVRGAAADDSQGLKLAANFHAGGGGQPPSNAAAAGGGTAAFCSAGLSDSGPEGTRLLLDISDIGGRRNARGRRGKPQTP